MPEATTHTAHLSYRIRGASSATVVIIFALWTGEATLGQQDRTQVEALQDEVRALRARLEQLESRLEEQLADNSPDSSPPSRTISPVSPDTPPTLVNLPPTEDGEAQLSGSGSERTTSMNLPADTYEPAIRVGGALRFNGIHRDFVDSSTGKRGEGGLDVFRLNIDGELDNLLISAEYRFYPYMDTLHHGWIGYRFRDDSELQFGVHQVPFGLLPYASHNAWFGVPYYAGFADNYDAGIRYERRDGPWMSHLAFYKNEELNDATNLDRYSFDIVRQGQHQNEEVNRINFRQAYILGAGTGCETELGGSLQRAQLYNTRTDRRGDHWAAAAHVDQRCGRWNLQLQGTRYHYDPVNPAEADDKSVRVGAFSGSYDLVSSGTIGVANLAYNFDSPWQGIELITCYNDYSRLFKRGDDPDSRINTTGCAVGSGPIFAYFDYILANNMPYFSAGSLAGEGEEEWHGRFNINIGYYW